MPHSDLCFAARAVPSCVVLRFGGWQVLLVSPLSCLSLSHFVMARYCRRPMCPCQWSWRVVMHVLSRGCVRLHDCVHVRTVHRPLSSRVVLSRGLHISHRGVVPSRVLLPSWRHQRHVQPLCTRAVQRRRVGVVHVMPRWTVWQHVVAAVQSVLRNVPVGLLLPAGVGELPDEPVPSRVLLPGRSQRRHSEHGAGGVLRSHGHWRSEHVPVPSWSILHRCGPGRTRGSGVYR